jgi:hypothetical protein
VACTSPFGLPRCLHSIAQGLRTVRILGLAAVLGRTAAPPEHRRSPLAPGHSPRIPSEANASASTFSRITWRDFIASTQTTVLEV